MISTQITQIEQIYADLFFKNNLRKSKNYLRHLRAKIRFCSLDGAYQTEKKTKAAQRP